jgi:hypothetical protein
MILSLRELSRVVDEPVFIHANLPKPFPRLGEYSRSTVS